MPPEFPVRIRTTPSASRLSRLWLPSLVGLAVALLLLSTYQRIIQIDEAWIGEQAYWAARDGVVRSELFRGFLHAEVRQLVYHKLFVWQAAGLIRVAGWSVTALRLLSLAYLGLFVGLCWRYLRTLDLRPCSRWLYMLLLLANTLVAEFSFTFRPEIMLMTLGFASWQCLQLAAHARRGLWYVAGAGLLAGLAALTHLNGLIFVGAGGLLLLWRRQAVAVVVFAGPVLVCAGCYFLEVGLLGAWAAFGQQLQPAVQPEAGVGAGLRRLLHEHKRLFHSFKESPLSVCALLASAVLYRHRSRFAAGWLPELLLYTLALLVLLAVGSQNDNSFYTILYIPFLVLLITAAFDRLPEDSHWLNRVARVLLGAYLLLNFGGTLYLTSRHRNMAEQHQRLVRHLAPYRGAAVVAPLPFVYNGLEHFAVQGTFCYYLLAQVQAQSGAPFDFFAQAARFQRQLLLLDEESLELLHLPRPRAGQSFGAYHFSHRFESFYIYTYAPPRRP
ncbi:hypothetical protein KBK19_12285 [Microvirga sp. STR05]|uniref:Glycosyltransferase RgtA/B/C/D-like domain-containing protein n=1 Tax=Hymenobacter duratus TaxID=2771356 RepID=A0ABR8JM06_9BACT|nr:hypothetical protein [Hymenobacter duratus]MBD2715814.1 hypothetical protein [Hymenobacter duratus]MBR7950725.1 hypothetical protein [Microvirga sp. STR05]